VPENTAHAAFEKSVVIVVARFDIARPAHSGQTFIPDKACVRAVLTGSVKAVEALLPNSERTTNSSPKRIGKRTTMARSRKR
jgi:hypothetical protein